MPGCAQESGPPISIVEVKILAPLPGSSAAVAYFRIENRSDTTITVNQIDSPQYDDVQMHETVLEDGVSRMRPVGSIEIDPASSVDFTPGGLHVMLMKPSTNTLPGSPVTLEIRHDNGLLIVNATMQNRMPVE